MKWPIRPFICLIVMFAVLALGGCEAGDASFTYNMQRSVLRTTGDVAATAWLDNVAIADVVTTKAELNSASAAIEQFLLDGKVANLTESDLRARLVSIIPTKYQRVVDTALVNAGNATVKTEAIGADNLERIKSFVSQFHRAVQFYDSTRRVK